ncbi:toxin, partial [Neisseria gonorrhoeae]
DFHNKAFEGFKNTVATHEAEFDRIRVTNRPGEILYDSLNKQQNKQASAKDAMEFYQQITPERLKQVAQVWDVIQLQADRRSQD